MSYQYHSPGDAGHTEGFSPVDPFKPSLQYSLRKKRHNPESESRRPSPPGSNQPLSPAIVISAPSSPYRAINPRRQDSRHYRQPSISSHSSHSSRHRHPEPSEQYGATVVIQRRSPSTSSDGSSHKPRRSRHIPEPLLLHQPSVEQGPPSSPLSSATSQRDEYRLPEMGQTILVPFSPSTSINSGLEEIGLFGLPDSVQPIPSPSISNGLLDAQNSHYRPSDSVPRRETTSIFVKPQRSSSPESWGERHCNCRRRRSLTRMALHDAVFSALEHPSGPSLPQRREVIEKYSSPCSPARNISTPGAEAIQPPNIAYLPPVSVSSEAVSETPSKLPFRVYLFAYIFDTIPRQIYLHLLLRIPYVYFTRVIRMLEEVLDEANMTLPQIKQNILEGGQHDPAAGPTYTVIQYGNLERSWSHFVDSLMKEWKTFNIISVLLLSAILAIMNMPQSSYDPLTTFPALMSMIAALMSLIYGCMYNIRFQTMRKGYKAIEWAEEGEKTKSDIFWNVWVFLAMPATWLAWSLIFFIVCLIAFIWRFDTVASNGTVLTQQLALIPRILASSLFGLGFLYFFKIIGTLRRYGSVMDNKWQIQVKNWLDTSGSHQLGNWMHPVPSTTSRPGLSRHGSRASLRKAWTQAGHTTGVSPFMLGRRNNMSLGTAWPLGEPLCLSPSLCHSHSHSHSNSNSHSHSHSSHSRSHGNSDVGLVDPPHYTERSPVPSKRICKKSLARNGSQYSIHLEGAPSSGEKDVRMLKLVDLDRDANFIPLDDDLTSFQISKEQWKYLNADILKCWEANNVDSLNHSIVHWNLTFHDKGGQIALCDETAHGSSRKSAIYFFSTRDRLLDVEFSPDFIPDHLRRLSIICHD